MRPKTLDVENILGVKHVRIEVPADATLFRVLGMNGQGKTSIFEALELLLAGRTKLRSIEEPLHRDATSGHVKLTLDTGVTIERGLNVKGARPVVVKDADGNLVRNPADFIDAIAGSENFDALAFTRATPKQQASTLLQAAGLLEQYDVIDASIRTRYAERTELNREAKTRNAQLETLPNPKGIDLPDEPIIIEELSSEIASAAELNAHVGINLEKSRSLRTRIERSGAHVERLERELKEARAEHNRTIAELELHEFNSIFETIDTAELNERLHKALEINRQIEQRRAYQAALAEHTRATTHAEECTIAIAEMEALKKEMLGQVAIPVDGLSVTEDGVFYNGLPLAQASYSERVRVSLAVAAALYADKLRVLRIENGGELDAGTIASIEKLAGDAGFLVFLEQVRDERPADAAFAFVWMEDGIGYQEEVRQDG